LEFVNTKHHFPFKGRKMASFETCIGRTIERVLTIIVKQNLGK
jgi:hypothetical protein